MALACALPAAAQTSSTLPVKHNSLNVRQIAGQQDRQAPYTTATLWRG